MNEWTRADIEQLIELVKVIGGCAWLCATALWFRLGWETFDKLIARKKL